MQQAATSARCYLAAAGSGCLWCVHTAVAWVVYASRHDIAVLVVKLGTCMSIIAYICIGCNMYVHLHTCMHCTMHQPITFAWASAVMQCNVCVYLRQIHVMGLCAVHMRLLWHAAPMSSAAQ